MPTRTICITLPEQKKPHKKSYYHRHYDKMLIYSREYYNKNKTKICQQRKIKVVCDCGSITTHSNSLRHLSSIRHQNYITALCNAPECLPHDTSYQPEPPSSQEADSYQTR